MSPSTPSTADLAAALLEIGCVKFGAFTLKSGRVSPIYLDLRRLASYPRTLRLVATAYAFGSKNKRGELFFKLLKSFFD